MNSVGNSSVGRRHHYRIRYSSKIPKVLTHRPLKPIDMNVVIEDVKFKAKVVNVNKIVDRRKTCVRRFLVKKEPRYYFEPLGGNSLVFLKKTKDNKLKGMFDEGRLLANNPDIEKKYFLSKLNLIPSKRIKHTSNGLTNSLDDDEDNELCSNQRANHYSDDDRIVVDEDIVLNAKLSHNAGRHIKPVASLKTKHLNKLSKPFGTCDYIS